MPQLGWAGSLLTRAGSSNSLALTAGDSVYDTSLFQTHALSG